jgi:O-antigen/teichoic acid export membrane protein
VSLKHNILANYASQLYVTAAGILMVPLYFKYMGAEAYGLVGFFAMLQALFNLLDMGLTPTMARESARFHGGALSLLDYRRLARALEGVFAAIALLGGTLLFTLAQPIASHWLNANQLPQQDIVLALQIIAIIIVLRWMCGLYRGVITGAERLVWLSGFNSLIATVRFVIVLPVLMFVSATPQAFFTFQLVVASLEFVGLAWMAYRLLPAVPTDQRIRWEWAPLKPVLKFSLSIAFTSSVWVLVTQTDKLVLSKILPLADYGYFTVAVLVASGIMVVTGPISSALMPRMARLQAQGQNDQVIAVYRKATQWMMITTAPIVLVLALFSEKVLWAWTGNTTLVEKASPILSLYAAGYGVLAVSAFPYYLQYAKGNLKLHLIGSFLFALLLIPSVIWSATQHGMLGAGWAWFLTNVIYFIIWVPFVHRSFAKGLHLSWVANDVIGNIFFAMLIAAILKVNYSWGSSRMEVALELVGVGITLSLLVFLRTDNMVAIRGFVNQYHRARSK